MSQYNNMKYDLDAIRADVDNFMVHEHEVAGEKVYLVQPTHIGCTWTRETLNRRSVVVNAKGEVVSASFKKFFNWDEKPDISPMPKSLTDAQLLEKLDGSTLIFSRYKRHTIARTRGTVDARTQLNGYEIDLLLSKYPKFAAFLELFETSPHSYLFEWTSPANKIVIDYGVEPDMYLIGMIGHADYFMQPQSFLDLMAKDYDLKRPRVYNYASIEEMKSAVEDFKGVEGLCVYYNEGQDIRKVKGAQYLFLHRAKSDISSVEKVIDVYIDYKNILGHAPSYTEFFDYLAKIYDYEIAVMARGHISNIADAMKDAQKIIDGMTAFVTPYINGSRKDAAMAIMQAYGSTGRSAMLFKMYDRKPLVDDDYKKLLYQVLKN